jgi:hypothetical protein
MSHADDEEEIADYRRRLDEVMPRIRKLVSGWAPLHFEDPDSYIYYVSTVEEAIEHAEFADLESLQSGPFYDGLDIDSNYYLEFTRDPNEEEMRRFQAALFQAYLDSESDNFNHLVILKRTLPMIRVTLM